MFRRRRGSARTLRLATRGSPLARIQAGLVAGFLEEAHPGLTVEAVVVQTSGDRLSGVPLDRIGGQGVFVKEIQVALRDGRAEVAVHSAKDLPSITPEDLLLAAVPPRADPRDALVGRRIEDLPPGATVATGSARRRAQLANVRPDLTFVDLRGNMSTRMAKVRDGAVDAVIVAVAALDRLGWSEQITQILSVSQMLPQVGQGALAVECRRDDPDLVELLAAIDDASSHAAVSAERALLAALGADCSVPVGGYAELTRDATIQLEGLLASGDGRILVRAVERGTQPESVGAELAKHLVEDCGGSAIDDWAPAAAPRVAT